MALTDPRPAPIAPVSYVQRQYKLTLQRDRDGVTRKVVIAGASVIAARIIAYLDHPPSEWWLLNVERLQPDEPPA